jgi:ADP-heptose:LPS heptosyltransferase
VRILAIRLARFGDIVLLLPALTLLKERLPGCHLTFLTDVRWASLAALSTAVDEVITLDRVALRNDRFWRSGAKIWQLLSDLRRRKFDAVIDCHGFRETNLLAWWTGAPRRLGLRRFDQSFLAFCFNLPPVMEDKTVHVSEMFRRIVRHFAPSSTDTPEHPAFVIPADDLQWVNENLPDPPFAVLYVDAPVKERMWPLVRFAALANHLVTNLNVSVVVIGGLHPISTEFPEGIRVLSQLPVSRLAAAVASARLLVSNDTGPMHLGPLLGTPTVGIFSVGLPEHFRPTGIRDRYVQGNPIEKVEVDEVIRVVNEVWTMCGR